LVKSVSSFFLEQETTSSEASAIKINLLVTVLKFFYGLAKII